METKVTRNDATEFMKLLVELGGYYTVDDEYQIIHPKSGIIGIKQDKTVVPLRIYNEDMEVGDYAILNVFHESLAKSKESEWFYGNIMQFPGSIIKHLIKSLVKLATSEKENVSYDQLDILTPYIDKMDTKMIKEIEGTKTYELAFIEYDKKRKRAQLVTSLHDPKFIKKNKTVRKKTWDTLQGLFDIFIGTEDMDVYVHKATVLGLQEADAVLHVLCKVCQALDEYSKKILDIDLRVPEFVQHMDRLEDYHKLCAYFSTATANVEKKHEKTTKVPPWEQNNPFVQAPPQAMPQQGQFPPTQQGIYAQPGGTMAIGPQMPMYANTPNATAAMYAQAPMAMQPVGMMYTQPTMAPMMPMVYSR